MDMPNLKIYVDETVDPRSRQALRAGLQDVQDMLCRDLSVPVAACQLNIVAVTGLPDQPLVNAEIQILAKPDRTPDMVRAVCQNLQDHLTQACGTPAAIRASALDPETYIALK
ncbi:hypothetical protein [Youngimonas ophiurae (nom. illeg.)]|uniref:hypothetical protein n=1 Tax=Thalassobius sp. S69A TaxID=3450125 RepID=UPI004056511A